MVCFILTGEIMAAKTGGGGGGGGGGAGTFMMEHMLTFLKF